jgi:hypothetical protein
MGGASVPSPPPQPDWAAAAMLNIASAKYRMASSLADGCLTRLAYVLN